MPPFPGMVRGRANEGPSETSEVTTMTLTSWITALAMVSTVTVTGVAFAQQPTPPPSTTPNPVTTRGTGVSMSNPATPDGKPITESTNFGSR